MATNNNCSACEQLRQNSPEFALNGVTDTVSASLKNDTGFNPSSGHTDCEDIDDANDCLIGNMTTEIKAYGVCDWKKFMKKFIPNVHELFEAINCALCGIWTNIHKHDCEIKYLYEGARFKIGEDTSGNAYAVAGRGVSFLNPSGDSDEHTSDLFLLYIAGGLIRGGGSFNFYHDDFTDGDNCMSFDTTNSKHDAEMSTGKHRLGNTVWFTNLPKRMANGGELIVEFRIKKSAYPQIKKFYDGFGHETGGGSYRVITSTFDGDDTSDDKPTVYAYGQHGWCHEADGTPMEENYSYGHAVPSGWVYVQLRMTTIEDFHDTKKYTPRYFMGVRMNQDKIPC